MPAELLGAEGLARIKRNCHELVGLAREVYKKDICFDDASIQWLAWLIEFIRDKPDDKVKMRVLEGIGSLLGEAMVVKFGGEWVLEEGALFGVEEKLVGVRLPTGMVAFPFAKASKQLKNGETDSIWGMYKSAGDFAGKSANS